MDFLYSVKVSDLADYSPEELLAILALCKGRLLGGVQGAFLDSVVASWSRHLSVKGAR
ncbi:hypothetical protein OO256_26790 [Pseudomonas sp. DCB_CB]|uniref:hypothetical protein n=1 Tax=unclassified Pseudomonas TaxID=196821 RepID=UPI00224942B6|nr:MULTISPECIES: hypothetical protein [unclassified Pseudomonas]MCX2694477.1 hypothetical protein [Pseudomonas sp. DCB_BZ]MCX2859693.1 hypothetical protein [Pseudomonas sp. DCB_CB]